MGVSDNGVWEVPPQNQMQNVMLAPGILGAGVAAMAQDSEQRSLPFGASGPLGQGPMLPSNQFALNGLNGVTNIVPPPGIGLGINAVLPPNLANAGIANLGPLGSSINRAREAATWTLSEQSSRYPSRSSPCFAAQDLISSGGGGGGSGSGSNGPYNAFGNNSNSAAYRPSGLRPNHPILINKMQELDGRRNPNAFQQQQQQQQQQINLNQAQQHYDVFGPNGPESRDRGLRNSCNSNSSRFSNDNNHHPGGHHQSLDGNCVEVRNMPLDANYSDIRHAFQGLYIRKDGLKLINDTHGNRVGIAYIKFSKGEGKDAALTGPRFIRGSEVEVLHLDENIFDKAIDSFIPERNNAQDKQNKNSSDTEKQQTAVVNNASEKASLGSSSCINVTELPSFTKEMDIAKLFNDSKINDLFISVTKDSKSAYVQFSRVEEAKSALTTGAGGKLKIGPKIVAVNSITEEKFIAAKRIHEQENNGKDAHVAAAAAAAAAAASAASSTECVLVRGIPFHAMTRDVLDWFADGIGIIPHRIHMMLNANGKPAGKCFCEFDNPEDAGRAATKNGVPFGKNLPSIELVGRGKMLEALAIAEAQMMEAAQHHQHYSQNPDMRPPRFSPMPPPRFGNAGGGAGGFGPLRGGPPPPPPPPGMHMGMHMGRHMGMPRHPHDYVEGFGKPGCVLSLENVPFKADIDEIIKFFRDFDVKRENVIRRYNEKGMPTGDARVAFVSPNEAQRALRELRHCKVRDRTIFMKIA